MHFHIKLYAREFWLGLKEQYIKELRSLLFVVRLIIYHLEAKLS